ncbi:hypothetical protein LCGC14_0923690 [marine sediment metagenome]|uniref:Uncharacterized protein n=1 Tax=marine sediment metagenome TaxID=412755 RepID=A0A0F9NUT1_9ZZZZ
MRYKTNCTASSGKSIQAMVDNAKEISWDDFMVEVDEGEIDELFPSKHPHISEDYAVEFYRSTFLGVPCVFVQHSAIEYVFY